MWVGDTRSSGPEMGPGVGEHAESAEADPVMTKFWLYATKTRYYLVGHTKDYDLWRVLKFTRADEPTQLEVVEDPTMYTHRQIQNLLSKVHDGNMQHGGLKLICEAFGIIGCFRFLEGYYLLLITKRRYLGTISGQKVYGVANTVTVPILQPALRIEESSTEKRYRKLLIDEVDLTKDFFFSYHYCLSRTLQQNVTDPMSFDSFDSMFVWNDFLTRALREQIGNSRWLVPLIHGFWEQRSLSVLSCQLSITLIARRSKYFAGTRYRKRGINDNGHVANDVEVEQLVSAGMDRRTGRPIMSSMVQMRGSIPLYWAQDQASRLKPDVLLQHYDPMYQATLMHFKDLGERYGYPIVAFNLVKQLEKRPRETILGAEFATAIDFLNRRLAPEQRIRHVPWDFNHHLKHRGTTVLADMAEVLADGMAEIGFFTYPGRKGQAAQVQHGVLRTNCIDCLDRTNVAQFAAGVIALGRQLHALGLTDTPVLDSRCSFSLQLMDMYENMGNSLARQYGGSEAHSTFFQRARGDWEPATQSRDLMTSLRRFYSNAYTDAEKQGAINLFLGNFIPHPAVPPLWELDSDYYLHYTAGRGPAPVRPVPPKPASQGQLSASAISAPSTPTQAEVELSRSSLAAELGEGLPEAEEAPTTAPSSAVHLGATATATLGEAAKVAASAADRKPGSQRSSPRSGALERRGSGSLELVDLAPVRVSLDSSKRGPSKPGGVQDHIGGEGFRRTLSGPAWLGAAAADGPRNRSKRMRLESFDRLLAKPGNLHVHVRLHAPLPPAAQQRPVLPQWLTTPLGKHGGAQDKDAGHLNAVREGSAHGHQNPFMHYALAALTPRPRQPSSEAGGAGPSDAAKGKALVVASSSSQLLDRKKISSVISAAIRKTLHRNSPPPVPRPKLPPLQVDTNPNPIEIVEAAEVLLARVATAEAEAAVLAGSQAEAGASQQAATPYDLPALGSPPLGYPAFASKPPIAPQGNDPEACRRRVSFSNLRRLTAKVLRGSAAGVGGSPDDGPGSPATDDSSQSTASPTPSASSPAKRSTSARPSEQFSGGGAGRPSPLDLGALLRRESPTPGELGLPDFLHAAWCDPRGGLLDAWLSQQQERTDSYSRYLGRLQAQPSKAAKKDLEGSYRSLLDGPGVSLDLKGLHTAAPINLAARAASL